MNPFSIRGLGSWLHTAPPMFYSLLGVLLVLGIEQVIESFAARAEREGERATSIQYLGGVRARLEGVISANLLLVHGLGAVIQAHPDIDQTEFSRIGRGLVGSNHALRNVAAAPNLVLRMIYPLEGNQQAIGLDYRKHPTQGAAALRAVASGQPVVAGPLALVQGGEGIIVREAVYLPPAVAGDPARLWGLISGVLDTRVLYQLAGMEAGDPGWRIALRGTDGTGAAGPTFFGDRKLFAEDAVTADIHLPGGSWQIAAKPAAGWGQVASALSLIRLLGMISAALVAALSWRLAVDARGLSATLARLRSLVDTMPDLFWMKDPEGVYLACNSGFEALVGASEAAIVGRRDQDFFPSALADKFIELDRQAIATRQATRSETWLDFRSDGHRALFETVKAPVYGRQGEVLGVLGVSRDITQRRATEQRARMGEIVLDSVFQALPDLFFLMDGDGTIRDYRARRSTDLYVEASHFLGRRMQDVLPAGPAGLLRQALDQLATQGELRSYEYDLELPHGTRRFEARLSRLQDSPQVIAVVRDVTEQHLSRLALAGSEARFRQLNAELEARVAQRTAEIAAANRELETFAYLVSHDLKAPLRGIDGYSRLLLEDHATSLDAEARGFLDNIRRAVGQMAQLIEDLLAYSRAERRAFDHGTIALAPLLQDILADWQSELRSRSATVRVDAGKATVRGDREGLRLVIGNLIDNALKFARSGEPPDIAIHAEAHGGRTLIQVRDQGIGFDMRFQERIFEIFQRLQRAEDYPGTGVGLAIVRKAVERMGGRVWAESAPGQGTTFFVELEN